MAADGGWGLPHDCSTSKLSRLVCLVICCADASSSTDPRCEISASSHAPTKPSSVPDKTSRTRHHWRCSKRSPFMLPAASMRLSLLCSKWLRSMSGHQILNGIGHLSAATPPLSVPLRPPRSRRSSTTSVRGIGYRTGSDGWFRSMMAVSGVALRNACNINGRGAIVGQTWVLGVVASRVTVNGFFCLPQ